MIHFTPIQRLGNSNSAYSLSDQLKLNLTFTCEGGAVATLEDVATLGELNLFCKLFIDLCNTLQSRQ